MSTLYEMIGRLTVWFVRRRAVDRVSSPSVVTVIAVALASALVGLLGVGLLLGSGSDSDDPA